MDKIKDKTDICDIDPDKVSDVIYFRHNGRTISYVNRMTGKSSCCLQDVLRGRRFICTDFHSGVYGYYIRRIEEDTIVVINTALVPLGDGDMSCPFKWEATGYMKVTRKDGGYAFFNYNNNHAGAIDICGQAVYNSRGWYKNIENRDEYLSFFKGGFFVLDNSESVAVSGCPYYNPGSYHFKIYSHILDFPNVFIREASNSSAINDPLENAIGVLDYSGERDKLPQLPDEALKKIENFGKRAYRALYAKDDMRSYAFNRDLFVYCVQKFNGAAYMRVFGIYFNPLCPCMDSFQEVEVRYIEIMVLKLENATCLFDNDYIKAAPVWCDDLSGTPFAYTQSIFLDAIDDIEKQDIPFCEDYFYSLCAHAYYPSYYTVKLALWCTEDPLFEKIYNDNIFRYEIMGDCYMGKKAFTTCYIGEYYDAGKEKLHACLGVPKHLLDLSRANRTLHYIAYVKDIFGSTKESREYLERMNSRDVDYLFDTLLNTGGIVIIIVKTLIKVHGPAGWKRYADFAFSAREDGWFRKEPDFQKYMDYMGKLRELGPLAKDAEWRVPPDRIDEALRLIEKPYLAFADTKIYKEAAENFAKYQQIWEGYCYEEDEFAIIQPKVPSDVIKEGMALHHCAKEFIEVISRGETILMFIRKKTAPEKPYFTLEIKEGKIRQCHGFKNCFPDDKLESFLQRYCKEMKGKVDYMDCNEAMGP